MTTSVGVVRKAPAAAKGDAPVRRPPSLDTAREAESLARGQKRAPIAPPSSSGREPVFSAAFRAEVARLHGRSVYLSYEDEPLVPLLSTSPLKAAAAD